MFAKLVVLIVGVGVCGGSLLAMRQARVQMAHEMAESRLRMRVLDERLSRVRAEIAESVHPDRVELMASRLGPLSPAVPEEDWPGPVLTEQRDLPSGHPGDTGGRERNGGNSRVRVWSGSALAGVDER